jgi:nucleoside-triphosphatase THEP1
MVLWQINPGKFHSYLMGYPVLILTAAKGIGKTTRLEELAKKAGGRLGGILSPVIEGKRFFMHPGTGKNWPMEASGKEERLEVGRFSFSSIAFNQAAQQVLEDHENPEIRALVIDEIGPLELKGLGFTPLLKTLLAKKNTGKQICLVVREGLHEEVAHYFNIPSDKSCVVSDPNHLHWENGYFYTIND